MTEYPEDGTTIFDLFEKHEDEYLKFDRIPEADRRHSSPDVCAFIAIAEWCGLHPGHDLIGGAEYDIIYLKGNPELLTEEQVIYLRRCGISYDSDVESLYSVV